MGGQDRAACPHGRERLEHAARRMASPASKCRARHGPPAKIISVSLPTDRELVCTSRPSLAFAKRSTLYRVSWREQGVSPPAKHCGCPMDEHSVDADGAALGLISPICAGLCGIPLTSILRAILLRGHFGWVAATHWRLGELPLAMAPFAAYSGVLVWPGPFLREPGLNVVAPLRQQRRRKTDGAGQADAAGKIHEMRPLRGPARPYHRSARRSARRQFWWTGCVACQCRCKTYT